MTLVQSGRRTGAINIPTHSYTPKLLRSSTSIASSSGSGWGWGWVCPSSVRGPLLKCTYSSHTRIRTALSDTPTHVDASPSLSPPPPQEVPKKLVSVILLAGGQGKRMGASMPKQYLPLLGVPIALHSFFTFARISEVKEIIAVCDSSYRDIFEDAKESVMINLKFASPGKERQDSVYNGLQEIDPLVDLVCVHDSARPLVSPEDVEKVLQDAWVYGAAVLGVPVKATIKEANNDSFVVKTLDRQMLWEMQTPQVIKPGLLRKGFELVQRCSNLGMAA